MTPLAVVTNVPAAVDKDRSSKIGGVIWKTVSPAAMGSSVNVPVSAMTVPIWLEKLAPADTVVTLMTGVKTGVKTVRDEKLASWGVIAALAAVVVAYLIGG